MENMVKLKPREIKGSRWDEIVQIQISYAESDVFSIKFVYVVDGKVVPSQMHGKPHGPKFDTVTFDYPEEYLVSVSGEHHDYGLASIAFGTNKRMYGPFGKMADSEYNRSGKFAYNFGPKSSFGGFHGSVEWGYVYAIGVYVRPLASLADFETDIGGDQE